MKGRIDRRFAALRAANSAGLITFVMAGDPDPDTSLGIIRALPGAGADLIEIGMPFTDPMADGPAIQQAGLRALAAGQTMRKTLDLVREFRAGDADTPVILMGYFNPLYIYGVESFVRDASTAGVDGLIIVDLPLEEEDELRPAAQSAGIDVIRLVAPTTDTDRLRHLLVDSAGFVYYVSVAGVTGARGAGDEEIAEAVSRVQAETDLPIAVGFGIRTPDRAAAVARYADAAVVGTAIVQYAADRLDGKGEAPPGLAEAVAGVVDDLARAVHAARTTAPDVQRVRTTASEEREKK